MFQKISKFFREVRSEMSKVTWPTREELIGSTSVVIVLSLIFAVFIGILDVALSFISRAFYGR